MDSYPQLWFRRAPGEDTVLLLVSLTSSHKIPLNSCGAQLLPQSCLLSEQVSPCWAHAAHSHWPQAHISTQPCHHSFCVTAAWAGSDWCLLVSRKKGEGVTTFEKQEIGFFHAISLFLLLIWFHRLVTSQQAWLCDRNKVSLLWVPAPFWDPSLTGLSLMLCPAVSFEVVPFHPASTGSYPA